jgi:hypothetical protein
VCRVTHRGAPGYIPSPLGRYFIYALTTPFQNLKEESEIVMETPDNLDAFLTDLLQKESNDEPAPHVELDDDDRAFVERIMESVTTGSKGIFVVLHPNDRMQYMLLNTNRAGAIALLAKVMQRTAEALEADLE